MEGFAQAATNRLYRMRYRKTKSPHRLEVLSKGWEAVVCIGESRAVSIALFVHGTCDGFGSTEELTAALRLIPTRTEQLLLSSAGHELMTKRTVMTCQKWWLKHFYYL